MAHNASVFCSHPGIYGCGKRVDVDKTMNCTEKQPYKYEKDCKTCCGADMKVQDKVCLRYK